MTAPIQGEYKPIIPPIVRTVVYYLGVAAGAVGIILVGNPTVARVALAIGFIAGSLGVAYRPTKAVAK